MNRLLKRFVKLVYLEALMIFYPRNTAFLASLNDERTA